MYADTAAQTRSVEAAAMLYELMEPYADQFVSGGGVNFGHVRMSLALLAATLGRHEQADAHFAFACDFHRENGRACGRRGPSSAGPRRSSRVVMLSAPASTPPVRSSSPAGHGYGAFEPRAAAIVASDATIRA